jgi:hypothetical protein
MKEIEEKEELNLITLAQECSDEDKARGLLESLLWPDGATCPHCKNHKEKPIYRLQPKPTSKVKVRIPWGRKRIRAKTEASKTQQTASISDAA